ncbi:hypothetical protein FisN_11Hh355 [Fistulifera solaris]|jgi:hypothetical protein|uniref:Uncharacterized protein n=1 Tax=Fistulifera solaris TaxID=1519565 RepID=A0A1Z5K9F4_FISSO|nr:hypothetical protein FisN_11Hh355 [Fistulifera solaris]|eukprot:GAX22755.1 hypothetical protein FisN_11Hh355 [Fistulifera solaris]
MTSQEPRKISRTLVALGSTALLFAAAALGVYNGSVSFETLLDRNMLHQCNGPKRGQKLSPGETSFVAAMPRATVRLYYMPVGSVNRNDFCQCEVVCATGNVDLYMTDLEAFWIYPDFLNNWADEEEYECVSERSGNTKETCSIRGVNDDWYCYAMVRARTSATGCNMVCEYI